VEKAPERGFERVKDKAAAFYRGFRQGAYVRPQNSVKFGKRGTAMRPTETGFSDYTYYAKGRHRLL
jgi:hypothetical protein